MREILKPIFGWLTGNYNLFDNVIYNYFAIALVGALSFRVAWSFVGNLYKYDLISGRASGSIIHWVVRLLAFAIIFTAVSIIIWIIRLILSIPNWVGGAFVAVLVIGIVVISVRGITLNKHDEI